MRAHFPLIHITHSNQFVDFFGGLRGTKLKTVPRGFYKEDPAIDLLRYKQYLVRHDFTNDEVLKKDFPVIVSDAFQQMRSFFDYMSDILTSDLNGRSILL